MKVSTKRASALAWSGISMVVAAVAFLQFASMLIGFYDPIADDHMPPENLPFFRMWLAFQIVAFAFSAFFPSGISGP